MLLKKDFEGELRNLDSKICLPGFYRFKFQFHSFFAETFSTASTPRGRSKAFTRLACLSDLSHRLGDGNVVSFLHCMNDPQPEGHMVKLVGCLPSIDGAGRTDFKHFGDGH